MMAERGAFDHVEELDLGNCDVQMDASLALLQGYQLQSCRQLDLSGTRSLAESGMMPDFIQRLAQHEPLAGLRQLHLPHLHNSELQILASDWY